MSGTLPTWMEHWFGLSNDAGMGIAWRLDFHWPWPPWVSLLGLVALVVAIVGIYLRESRQASRGYRLALAALRLSVVGLVLLMIAQVELFLQRTGLPFVVVIIDDTRSMNIVDSYDQFIRKSLEDRVSKALKSKESPENPAVPRSKQSPENPAAPASEQAPENLAASNGKQPPEARAATSKATPLSRWNVARMLFAESEGG